jgi:hypothetical protein
MDDIEARLNSHEAVCALRYEQINARLKRIEQIMITSAGVVIASCVGTIFTFILTHK